MKYLIFFGACLISARAIFGIIHGDKIWIIFLCISFFWAYVLHASYAADKGKATIYKVQIYGFVGLAAILFMEIFLTPDKSTPMVIAYSLIYMAIIVRHNGIDIIKKKFMRK